jgi:hypothetical protein
MVLHSVAMASSNCSQQNDNIHTRACAISLMTHKLMRTQQNTLSLSLTHTHTHIPSLSHPLSPPQVSWLPGHCDQRGGHNRGNPHGPNRGIAGVAEVLDCCGFRSGQDELLDDDGGVIDTQRELRIVRREVLEVPTRLTGCQAPPVDPPHLHGVAVGGVHRPCQDLDQNSMG